MSRRQDKKRRTLVVDDDRATRMALSKILTELGYEVEVASTLAEALPKLSARLERLVLDLNLPDGSGLLLLKKVRSEGLPIHVAVSSACEDQQVMSELARLRPDAVFQKPLNLSEFIQWL
jgi:DNA-binding response OmpR family regulator